jgi:DNA-binding transcriptional ArsR family regulator
MDRIFKALADPTRRRILQLLRAREMTAGEIADQFHLAKPTLSGHFAVLREADLVTTERSGTSITYRLNASVLDEALLGIADLFAVGAPRRPAGARKIKER